MGTDIHYVFQAIKDGEWSDIPSEYDRSRHYALFAHLAGVRNGYGFAGVPTGQAVKPICEPRGLPIDFLLNEDGAHPIGRDIASKWELKWHDEDGDAFERWMGDHHLSWITSNEILGHNWPTVWKCGIIRISECEEWDGISEPQSYCGGISGPNVVVAETPCEITEDTTHVRVFWRSGAEEFQYFIDEVRRLHELHGVVRMVFGFDS